LKVDVWAVGVVMYGLVTGKFPFKGEEDVNRKKIQISSRASPECGDLLNGLLEKKEEARLTAQKALYHTFCTPAAASPNVDGQQTPVQGEITRDIVDNYQLDRRCNIVAAMQDAEEKKKKNDCTSTEKRRLRK